MICEIPLTRGMVALVDEADYATLSKFKWHVEPHHTGRFYAARREYPSRRRVFMHRQVLPSRPGMVVDHIDGNSLNNQRSNLRYCTSAENNFNQAKPAGAFTSKYKGVSWRSDIQKWGAQIGFQYRKLNLGYYTSEIEAALTYDAKARELFGEFARLNFPELSSIETANTPTLHHAHTASSGTAKPNASQDERRDFERVAGEGP